jgi:DNA uptake protein ComE-like DNA-binding protein
MKMQKVLALMVMGLLVVAAPVAAQMTGAAAKAETGPVLDPNTAKEEELIAVPNITPATAKAIAGKRPFKSMVELDAFLAEQKLTQEQRTEAYRRMFIKIDLNTASDAEIMLIPGMGKRMLHEFKEYRPYKAIEQFRREIGKYVSKDEVARFERYVKIG